MEAFVYVWKNKKNRKKYIGYHKGSVDDGYISSTSNQIFWEDYKKGQLEREIIFEGTRDECLKYEQDYLKTLDLTSDEWYNKARGAEIIFTKEVRDKIRNHHLGKSSGMKGKKHSEKTKMKVSKPIFDTLTNTIYKSAGDAAEQLGYLSRTFIYKNIKSKRFVYVNNDGETFNEDHIKKLRRPNKNKGKKSSAEFKKRMSDKNSDNNQYSFFNILTKEIFTGTRKEFSQKYGIAKHNIVGLVHGKTKVLGSEWILSKNVHETEK